MFSERLENLIKAALQDGALTEQEKASIIKRAQAEGEDIDEVDIYIQSLVQKKQQELAKEAQEAETARIVAQKKEREARMASELEEQKQRDHIMRKCPVCGGIIPALSNVCPHCQHVINSYETDEKMMEMMKKITAASERMRIDYDGNIYLDEKENTVSKDEYERLTKEWKNKPNIRFNIVTLGKNKYYCWYEKFDYYFPLLSELEKLYGNLPKVQEFLMEQKRKRLSILSNEFIKKINDDDFDEVVKAEKILNTITGTYGSLPEAQALISQYQAKIEERKKETKVKGTFKNIGCAIIIVIILLFCIIFG